MISYSFIHIIEDIDDKNEISQNFNESKIIIINQNTQSDTNSDELYFFISFQKTIIIIKQTSIAFLKSLFSKNKELKICFLSDSKENFEKNIKIQYQEIENNEIFQSEMSYFNTELKYKKPAGISFKEVWDFIQPCISGYLIKQSYEKLNKNRIDDFFLKRKKQKILIKNLDKEDYITIRHLGNGSIFMTSLVYHIEKEELFVIKKLYVKDDEIPKLSKRELLNYSSIRHPFLPEFYGTTKENYLIIEFINGSTLEHIKEKHLNYNEKIEIIFEIMITFRYLHERNYIFRDLKPNNIMIDQNKTVVLIDFDRMIKINCTSECSVEFRHDFAAPEIKSGKTATDKCDIYSIGQMINYIISEKQERIHNITINLNNPIDIIYKVCILENPEKRLCINSLILAFYRYFYSELQNGQILNGNKEYYDFFEIRAINNFKYILDNPDDPNALYYLGLYYLKTEIGYAINQFKKAAMKGHTNAAYYLGVIYEQNIYVQRDIHKSIYYYTLAAKKNHCESQYNLGLIYFMGKYVPKDINKGIQYIIQSANQNFPCAQFVLGFYYECYVRDLKSAFFYYNLTAIQNQPQGIYTNWAFFIT